MDNFLKQFMSAFGIKEPLEVNEVDIGSSCPLDEEVKEDLLKHCKKGTKHIKASFKVIRNQDRNYLIEGALAYHDQGKDRILYLKQELQENHVHGNSLINMAPGQEMFWEDEAETYQELASKLEKKVLSEHPEQNENGYEHAYVQLTNMLGIHARAAGTFVKEAVKYKSDIYVRNGKDVPLADVEIAGKKYIDGKSILSLMTLGAAKGSLLEIVTKGEDSKEAIKGLKYLISNKFYED